ncbi:hypothetical protein K490DRAFT_65744 [Saccharata proteae CBS 121410]|uniref:EH domain-containing protein n=1 Tax=Saccharata proteae CBS 121410 TaxID=1314787 RepID=A0A9P4HV28_9PEZI|nr:hypothetical protein K490DRAFT_65744 [Saccharata proteae CBS 121410]
MPSASQRQAESHPPHNTRDAALRGASRAFGQPPPKPKPLANTYTGTNGAVVAAQRSTTPHPPSLSGQQLRPQYTGSSVASQGSTTYSNPGSRPRALSHLGLPVEDSGSRARSPSNIAATIAAARRTPVPSKAEMNATKPTTVRSRVSSESLPSLGTVSDAQIKMNAKTANPPKYVRSQDGSLSRSPSRPPSRGSVVTDATPIPPTTSLVKLFEQQTGPATQAPKQVSRSPKPAPVLTSKGPPPSIKSPKPKRSFQFAPLEDEKSTKLPDMRLPKTAAKSEDRRRLPSHNRSVSMGAKSPERPKTAPKPVALRSNSSKGSVLPPKSTSASHVKRPSRSKDARVASTESDSDSEAYTSAPETRPSSNQKPALPPPRRSGKPVAPEVDGMHEIASRLKHRPRSRSTSTSNPKPPPDPPKHTVTGPSIPNSNSYQRTNLRHLQPHMTGDSLANAMVGAALASSRVPSPSISPDTQPGPAKRANHHHHGHHHHLPFHGRTPSPTKRPGMLKQTLRKAPSSSDTESDSGRDMKHKKKRHFRPKHPNKHHEGARKRWRESITEREKKRYEGVWAANRGLHLPPEPRSSVPASQPPASSPPARVDERSEDVLNLVVRDIWNRSHLPGHVLEEVWDLVDQRGVGRLGREEFVVGLWLVDQALKGRKLPLKVQESVWESVRGVGVKIRVRR